MDARRAIRAFDPKGINKIYLSDLVHPSHYNLYDDDDYMAAASLVTLYEGLTLFFHDDEAIAKFVNSRLDVFGGVSPLDILCKSAKHIPHRCDLIGQYVVKFYSLDG